MAKQAIQRKANSKGIVFCLCFETETNAHEVWKLCENYTRHVRGGLQKTWRYVERGMTKEQAIELFNRKTND